MAPIRYSLHYEDYSEHLMSRFGKLLQMQSLVDMTLMCSSHTLRVHKTVLAASSAYFQEVLQKQSGEPLIILKMRFSVLKSLVEFMYCGKTQCLEENLDELVSAAQFLKIKGLSKVTKEGLGIANSTELPVFTPPVVINRPPQSLIDLHSQDSSEPNPSPINQMSVPSGSTQQIDSLGRAKKDMVVRIPFDIEKGGASATTVDYVDPPRLVKPRRGRPSRSGAWESSGALGRAAERALMRREQDSRKAIHQLKHLQTRYSQDYMDRVTLSQAVSSICGPEATTNHNSYMNIDSDFMYMDQTVSSNVLDPTIGQQRGYSKEHSIGTDTSSYNTTSVTSANGSSTGISSAMSQYVNALKNAGLPTDLPILFESGDGSYINVNEQVLLDMVQSSEIQYEVIEQPNIIDNVADPSEIKSIDDLSKSIERGEMLMNTKSYDSTTNFGKDDSQYSGHEDAINSLNAILPDNLESFADQQNYVVLDQRLQESGNTMDNVNNDFSCIDGDMQFFTKSMSDDVKKYYEGQQLDDVRVMEQLCPTSTTLDTSFSISLLDTKSSHLDSGNITALNHDLRRNEDCYDFGLQLSQNADFKEDALDCLMATPKRNTDDSHIDTAAQERDEIIKDLMNIEKNMTQNNNGVPGCSTDVIDNGGFVNNNQDFNNQLNVGSVFDGESSVEPIQKDQQVADDISASSGIQWDNIDISNKENVNETYDLTQTADKENCQNNQMTSEDRRVVIDLTDSMNVKAESWGAVDEDEMLNNKENYPNTTADPNTESTLEDNIPYAVGLLPLKQIQPSEESSLLKRGKSVNFMSNDDAKCLKRKAKYKKLS